MIRPSLQTVFGPAAWLPRMSLPRMSLPALPLPALPLLALAVSLTLGLATAPVAQAVSPYESLAGSSPVTPDQLEAELAWRNAAHIHPQIASLYAYWGARYGIRADLAFAQMLHETNSLRYGGLVQPWQNNFAGIGATGPGHPGYSYPSPEAGVIAHYQLLRYYIDVRGCRTLKDLDGRWAVPGWGYSDAISLYASEIQGINPRGVFRGSFNELPGAPASGLSTHFYFTWYDDKRENGMAGNWILVGNQGSGTTTVEIKIAGQKMRDPSHPANDFFTIPEGGRITPVFPGLMAGPVEVISTSGQPLIASQRVLFHDSFNEVMGTPEEKLTDSYEFTWYDNKRENSMAGNWVLVSNHGSEPADVEISIGGVLMASYTAAGGNAMAPGAIVTPVFPGVMNGPVTVRSTNHQPLIVSQRVLFKESFNELMGYPSANLGSEYLFTWYDSLKVNGMRGDWTLVANRGAEPADVDIFVANELKARYSAVTGNAIPVGGMVTPQFSGLMAGPVRVVCTNGQPLMASQRVLNRDSFEEVQGTSPSALASDQLFTWYDSLAANYMYGDWVLVANRGTGDANVEIFIGGQKMRDPSNPGNDFFTIPEGGMITPQFGGVMNGPVRVTCTSGQPLMISQRVLFKYSPVLIHIP